MLLQIEIFEFFAQFFVSRWRSDGYIFSAQLSPESRICALAKKIFEKTQNSGSDSDFQIAKDAPKRM